MYGAAVIACIKAEAAEKARVEAEEAAEKARVAATGGSEFRDASKDASKDESKKLTRSQKKRIKRKASKAKRVAEEKAPKAVSGVHTRFREMKPCDDDDSDSSIEDFSGYGNSLCASPSSFS